METLKFVYISGTFTNVRVFQSLENTTKTTYKTNSVSKKNYKILRINICKILNSIS